MINIAARGFELKQGAKDGIDKELKRIEKMLPDSAAFDVTLAKKKDGYKCDITVLNIGSFVKGEATADRIEPAADMAFDEEVSMENFEQFDSGSVEIRRKKTISPQMMTDDEAIVQMEMLGHSFFVYLGIDGETKIVYNRHKGYGLLICE